MIEVREVMTRFRTLYDQRKRLRSILTDRITPSRIRLRTIWREFRRILFHSPEWLSWKIEPLADMRRRRERAERATLAEGFHRLLHSLHPITRSSLLGAGVFAFSVTISVIAGAAYADVQIPDRVANLAATLATIAEVLGGAAGILFAVIVFGIQFHGEKLDRAAFLVRYLRRREGLIPIAAFTLGVVAANAVVSLLYSLGLPYSAVPMAILDIPLIVLILWLVLWLIHRMAVSVSEDFTKLLMPSLTWEYDRALDEDIHHAKLMAEYQKALAAGNMRYSTVAGWTSFDRDPIKLKLCRRGYVKDINLTALQALSDRIGATCPKYEATLSVGPRDSVDDTDALILSVRRDEQGRQTQDVAAPDQTVVRELSQRLQQVFRLGSALGHDVVEVLGRFQDMLVGCARVSTDQELERWLEVQGTLIDRGLKRRDAVPSSFSIHRERLPDFMGGFYQFEMAQKATASGDQEKVSVLLTFSTRVMATAVEHQQPGLYRRAGQIIEAIYHHALADEELADFVGNRIDGILNSLVAQFEYAHSPSRDDAQRIGAQMPTLIADLSWRVHLMRTAMEAGRQQDASNFQDRMFRWDRHSDVRFARPHDGHRVAPELREACDLISYAAMICAGWCLHLIEIGHEYADTAKSLFQRCASDMGSRENLLRFWEAIRAKRHGEGHIDESLGVTHWTMPSPQRAGVSVLGWRGDAWIERGFHALLLARPSARRHECPAALNIAPVFRPTSPDEAQKLAESILSNDSVRQELLHIADDKRTELVKAMTSLFTERLRLFKIDQLQKVIAGEIDEARCSVLTAETRTALRQHGGIVPAIEKLGVDQPSDAACPSMTAQYCISFPKENLIATAEGAMHLGEYVAEGLRQRGSIQICAAAEKHAASVALCDDLRRLPDLLRRARRELGDRGFAPSAIFVPEPPRFIQAITGSSAWQLPNHRTLGDSHLGDWESCSVFQWPYVDCSSIVILDAKRFYGRTSDGPDAELQLRVEDHFREQHRQWLTQSATETDASRIPEAHDVCVLVTACIYTGLGLLDAKAVVRVDLDPAKLGYALLKNDDKYHRPDCDLVRDKANVFYGLAFKLPNEHRCRNACDRCRPDDLDGLGEHQTEDVMTAE